MITRIYDHRLGETGRCPLNIEYEFDENDEEIDYLDEEIPIIMPEYTETEDKAMQYAAASVDDWIQNAAHERARIAIDEIVNETMAIDEKYIVKIDLDQLEIKENIKKQKLVHWLKGIPRVLSRRLS